MPCQVPWKACGVSAATANAPPMIMARIVFCTMLSSLLQRHRHARRGSGRVRRYSRSMNMIARHWRGWTEPGNAEAYEQLLNTKVLPGLEALEGYRGGYLLRADRPDEVEFVVINFFDSIDTVKRFAG